MTGFGRSEGASDAASWIWELRSVNGRGLDLRFRLPPGFDPQEPALREIVGRTLRRGSVTATLSVRHEMRSRVVADEAVLAQVLALVQDIGHRIPGSPAPRPEALLALPGVLRVTSDDFTHNGAGEAEAIVAGFAEALDALLTARRAEGARLSATLTALLGEIAALCAQASNEAADQPAAQRLRLLESLHTLLREAPGLPEERIAQEVALLASRSDVREELDRLASHIEAAHALLAEGASIGRRFDFLVQEFNREVNTLCSKSASAALTATGLRLKAAIEQLREQVQNIE